MTPDEATPGEELPRNAPRSPWLAGLLSLLITGLGQVYNGQWRKGLAFLILESALGAWFWFSMADQATVLIGFSLLVTVNVLVVADAAICARRLKDYVPGPANRVWVYALVVAVNLGAGWAMQTLASGTFTPYKIPSASMAPTLLVGDRIMAEAVPPGAAIPRGQVVIFTLPDKPDMRLVKRVVGLPGETVSLVGRRVLVGGQPLDEPYAKKSLPDDPARDDMAPLVLGGDEYFVMGDNRDNSLDSRAFGPVRREWMKSRALYVILPAVGNGFSDRLGKELRVTRTPGR